MAKHPRAGYPILFENILIRRMIELADMKENDVFYDLGCGFAQNLIIAASEYGVKQCVGFERLPTRYNEGQRRVRAKSLSDRITIERNFDFADLTAADVVFYGLEPDYELVDWFTEKIRKKGARLISYANALLPAIKVTQRDHPFYLSKAPLTEAHTEHEWLTSIVGKSNLTTKELWREIFWSDKGNPKVGFFGPQYLNDLKALKKLLRRRCS